jgi:PAS domain S-box-containing protein
MRAGGVGIDPAAIFGSCRIRGKHCMAETLASWLLDPAGLTPHGFCLLWEPGLIWTYALSDAGIAVAYFTIPAALAVFARRRGDLVFQPMVWLFASFILLCGATHLLDVVTLWVPAYGIEAVVKAATAIVSIVTAIALWRLLPRALALPSPEQLREANEALRESEARHRASFIHSPVPMHTLDGNGVITGVSESWQALLGYAAHEAVGRKLADFKPPGPDGRAADDLKRLMADGEILDLERQFLRRDGRLISVLMSARLERRKDADWIVCVLIDVTGRRKAERALRASEERLHQAQKMETVGQLTGGVAHDFNNMLQAVSGCLDLMERRIEQGRPQEVDRYLASARTALNSGAALTGRMLAFARRQALQPTPVEPDALLRGMENLIRRGVGPEVQVELRTNGEGPALCDANQLESALLNLTLNARDAMPEGGSLTIATTDRMLTTADVSDQDDVAPGAYVEIAVADTGSGMTPDIMARAFEPFFTTRPIGRGSGLGLSQVYGFVRQSGGFVRLESQPGEGTTVRLFLPRCDGRRAGGPAPPATTDAAGATPPASSAVPGKVVLVVDDEDRVRLMLVEALRDAGCSVYEAEDGLAGLQLARSLARLDMLVTDIGLPGLNGRKLALEARRVRPDLPILLITGYAGAAVDDMKLAAGMEVMHKPFALDELTTRIRAMMGAPVRSGAQ